MTKTTSSADAPLTTSEAPNEAISGTPPTGQNRGSIYSTDAVSAQLAHDAFGNVRPLGIWVRLGGMLKHATGIHTFVPTVDIDTDCGVITRMTRVIECAFCKERR